MEQIVIIRADGSLLPLTSKGQTSGVTKAEQIVSLLGEDVVNISVKTAGAIEFYIGDKINVYGKTYTLNQLPTIKKIGTRNFEYTLNFEGVQYDLIDAQWLLPDETVLDSFTGDLDDFINILVDNANRVFPGTWIKGATPADTDTKTLTYTESNCLEVLQKVCEEYDTEFEITQNNGIRTINIKKAGVTFPYTFSYGRSGGLYELTRQNIDAKNVVTRLYVYGGSNNLGSKYRYSKLCLPGLSKNTSFIENSAAVEAFGIKENTKTFDKIYPKRIGKVTAGGSKYYSFIDNTMNFDLNEKEEDGKTTKWLINGVAGKIKVTSGNLAGYEFEIHKYDNETKEIQVVPFTDENGMKFPSETSAAFQFKVGDKYIFTDINLPDTYKTDAETDLQTEGEEYYSQYYQPQVQYGLSIDQNFIKQFAGELTIVNLFAVGDYIQVEDADIGLDKSIRITAFTRDLLQPYKYNLTLGDSVKQSLITRVISDLQKIDEVIKINNLSDPAQARRNWRSSQEVLASVFDTEGNYFSEKIKPLSIETSMLAVGAKSMQFILQNTLIEANYEGNKNAVKVTGGTLAHYTISENTRYWSLSSATTALISDSEAYYIYGKCQKGGAAGTIVFSTSQIKVEEDPNFYHFWIGVINSVDTGVRAISLTYGATTVNGRYIKTGRIESGDGKTYFDLDNSELKGNITFISSDNEEIEMGAYANSVIENINTAKTDAEAAAQTIAEAEAALAEARAVETSGGLISEEQQRAIDDAEAKLQEAKDHANGIEEALQGLIDSVDAKADEKKRVFVETPYTPYDIGDLWVDGEVLRRCLTKKPSGNFDPNHWVLAVYYDNTKTVINGGVVTSGTIQLAGSEQAILAGITGEGVSNESVRIWAGASKENRGTAPYRVLQDGSIIGTKGMIGGLTIEMNRLLSQGGRVEINGNDSIIALRDENGNIKTIIKPTDIPAISDYFKPGENFSGVFGFLNGTIVSTSSSADLEITDTSQSEYDLNIPSFSVENIAYAGSTNNPSVAVYSYVTVDLTRNGLTVERLKESEVTAYWDEYPGPYEAKESFTISVRKVVAGGGNWGIKITHHYRESIEGNGNGEGSCFVSGAGIATASKIVNRSEIGNNGMVIATSNQYYTYMVDDLYEVRRGLIGFRVTSTGIQKSTNMNMTTPTWNNI